MQGLWCLNTNEEIVPAPGRPIVIVSRSAALAASDKFWCFVNRPLNKDSCEKFPNPAVRIVTYTIHTALRRKTPRESSTETFLPTRQICKKEPSGEEGSRLPSSPLPSSHLRKNCCTAEEGTSNRFRLTADSRLPSDAAVACSRLLETTVILCATLLE